MWWLSTCSPPRLEGWPSAVLDGLGIGSTLIPLMSAAMRTLNESKVARGLTALAASHTLRASGVRLWQGS